MISWLEDTFRPSEQTKLKKLAQNIDQQRVLIRQKQSPDNITKLTKNHERRKELIKELLELHISNNFDYSRLPIQQNTNEVARVLKHKIIISKVLDELGKLTLSENELNEYRQKLGNYKQQLTNRINKLQQLKTPIDNANRLRRLQQIKKKSK